MDPFDKIIGYETIRRELERTADALKNRAYYERLGTTPPRGLLLSGEPGVGKTLMASCLIEASGRKALVCRKDQPDGKFVDVIRGVFEQAAREAPCIVLLDDLDKFANNDKDHKDSEEFVTVQSCIDGCRQSDVFVLATANDIGDLPESLLRPGRFDRQIKVSPPIGKDATEIVRHYLAGKTCVSDVDPAAVAGIMEGQSCAALETAINKAGLLAGYERCEKITMRHLLLGCLDIVHHVSPDSIPVGAEDAGAVYAACHEAGHALISEFLFPGSVSAICIYRESGEVKGFTAYRETGRATDLARMTDSAVRALGGRAAVRLRFGVADVGAGEDLERAQEIFTRAVMSDAAFGLSFADGIKWCSESLRERQEYQIAANLELCSHRAEQIVAAYRAVLDALTQELLRRGLLVTEDVRQIVQGAW